MIRRLSARTSVRNRIISMPAPWMAAGEPLQGEPAALERAVTPDCFKGVLRTGGDEAAPAARGECVEDRGNDVPVDMEKRDKQALEGPARKSYYGVGRFHQTEGTRFSTVMRNFRSSSSKCAPTMEGRATKTRSHEGGRRSWSIRKTSRMRRFARLRRTASPTRLEAMKPARRTRGSRSGRGRKVT